MSYLQKNRGKYPLLLVLTQVKTKRGATAITLATAADTTAVIAVAGSASPTAAAVGHLLFVICHLHWSCCLPWPAFLTTFAPALSYLCVPALAHISPFFHIFMCLFTL